MIAIAPVPWTAMKAEAVDRRTSNSADHVAIHAGKRIYARKQPSGETVWHAFDPEYCSSRHVMT